MTSWSGILDVLGTATITDLLVPVWLNRETSPPRVDLLFGKVYQRIFFDPMWTSGIRIGVAGAAGRWMEEYEDGSWTMRQHYWTPPV